MDASLGQFVQVRAAGACEYCRIPELYSALPFEIDHILARKHGGKSFAENLAWSCYYCNRCKGPNIAGIDPETMQITRLFNPRIDVWNEHFSWQGAYLMGRTAIGRATINVLCINDPEFVVVRELLQAEGQFPPP